MIESENNQVNKQKSFLVAHHKLIAPSNRYIVAKVDDRLVTFPDVLVSEIMIVDRSAILALPFYESAIVGVIHHQANIMPLLLLRFLIDKHRALITESLTVVRLSEVANELNGQSIAGVGVIVDRVIGSLTAAEYQNVNLTSFEPSKETITKEINQTVANIEENEYTPIEIILSSIPANIWQPQRWGRYNVG